MNPLTVGKVGRKAFSLPIESVGEAIAVLAKRGAGKTNTAVVLAEEMVRAGVQVVILDPVGAWWGIRSSLDGSGPGLSIPIVGGQHADVPLEDTAGKLLADVVVDTRSSMLLDLSDFPSKASVRRFVADFAERLYRRKARQPSALHLVLEEADEFAPQRPSGGRKGEGNDMRMLGAIEQIVRRGRSRGLGMTMVTQRSAKLNKDVLTQADTLVAMRTTAPHDIDAIKAWVAYHVGGASEAIPSLPGLGTGEAWFWNPEHDLLERVKVRYRTTFDSSATPKPGEEREQPTAAADIDLTALGEQIQATAERAEAEDPKALRKRIRDLEAELQERAPSGDAIAEFVAEAGAERQERLEECVLELLSHTESLSQEVQARVGWMTGVAADIRRYAEAGTDFRVSRKAVATPPTIVQPNRKPIDGLTGPQARILGAVAWLEAIGITPGDVRAVAFLAGYRPGGGAFNNPKGQLRSKGLIEYPRSGSIELTDDGRAIADPPAVPHRLNAFHEMVMAKLPGPESRILQVLLDVYPDDMSSQELADAAGYSQGGGAFNNPRSRLRTLGLIDYPSQGRVVALDVLFPAGLR